LHSSKCEIASHEHVYLLLVRARRRLSVNSGTR
jgi:hypothetical protein